MFETLHIYAQKGPHDDIRIMGDANSIEKLIKLLQRSLLTGGWADDDFFTNDGEGYSVRCTPIQAGTDLLPTPYREQL